MSQKILNFNHFYLVGIKGVAMTSLAQILVDEKKTIAGSDVKEAFVTQEILDQLPVKIDHDFSTSLPEKTQCVIYTAAHQAKKNPQVKQALKLGIPIYSQAEAIAEIFNQFFGVAVCGVGGKSTISAMITWVMYDLKKDFSFSVGVGNIPGVNKTGQLIKNGKYFVIEADEYVVNPQAKTQATPRFSFLNPNLIVCSNLKFDHPDVYQDFNQTKRVFNQFFAKLNYSSDYLIANFNDLKHIEYPKDTTLTFGEDERADFSLKSYDSKTGQTKSVFTYQNQSFELTLSVPGKFNVLNAIASIAALSKMGISPQEAANSLGKFTSTKRRFELIGKKNGVTYFDDYAHHPHEIAAAIAALNDWYPDTQKIVAFQSHTYSRTKQLFAEFVESFAGADEVAMIDIFSSAREKDDPTVSSDKLCQAIEDKFDITAQNFKTNQQLASYLQDQLRPGSVCLTLGAGDIYQVHDLI